MKLTLSDLEWMSEAHSLVQKHDASGVDAVTSAAHPRSGRGARELPPRYVLDIGRTDAVGPLDKNSIRARYR
jgi:hypothetical protein